MAERVVEGEEGSATSFPNLFSSVLILMLMSMIILDGKDELSQNDELS